MSRHPNYHPTSSSSSVHPSTTKVCLETSFTSLQSPCGGGDVPGNGATSSQLSSLLQYDVSSLSGDGCTIGPFSEATTVILTDGTTAHHHNSKGKNVAFDMGITANSTMTTQEPSSYNIRTSSPIMANPRGILQRNGRVTTKPTSLPIERTVSDLSRRIDLVHDDWYGMAPLASPETLSEISSISSRRTSLLNTFASSIERYLQRVSFGNNGSNNGHISSDDDDDSHHRSDDASQMHTPKVMRRTPKIGGNLSKCADDWRTVDSYKRMGKVFVTTPPALKSPTRVPSASSSGASFESADLFVLPPTTTTTTTVVPSRYSRNYSKSDDNLDGADEVDGEILSAAKLTRSDQQFHQQLQHHPQQQHYPAAASSSDTFHSAQSSLTHLSPHRKLPAGVLESHFPVFDRVEMLSTTEDVALLGGSIPRCESPASRAVTPSRPLSAASSSASTTASTVTYTPIPKFRLGARKRNVHDDDNVRGGRCESRPLLSAVAGTGDPSREVSPSPPLVRRQGRRNNRRVVYPILATFSPIRGRADSATPPLGISSSSSSSMASNRGGGESSV